MRDEKGWQTLDASNPKGKTQVCSKKETSNQYMCRVSHAIFPFQMNLIPIHILLLIKLRSPTNYQVQKKKKILTNTK